MAEYCRQCHDELFPPNSGFLVPLRNAKVICEGCGETVVDSQGRCTGACGKDEHSGTFMNYIFETKAPTLSFMNVIRYTPKTYFYKAISDTLQWFPRIIFLGTLGYLLYTSIKIRLLEVAGKSEGLELFAELSAAKANTWYQRSLQFWYKNEMRLEQLLF
jgi:hypothetical protein